MSDSLFYLIALTSVPQIGPVQARLLLQHFSPAEIFRAKRSDLQRIEGIGTERARAIQQFNDFSLAEVELRFLETHQVQAIPYDDPRFPQRLLHCYDPPMLLYYQGTASLNASRMLAIIGTRQPTEQGSCLTEQIVEELTKQDVMIVSGLAQGIDAIAHRQTLKMQGQTIGVLAHGLDRIYPNHHRKLAQAMRDAADAVGRALHRELGRPLPACMQEVGRAADLLDIYAEEGLRMHSTMTSGGVGEKTVVTRDPVGVVVAITPFNYPLNLLMFKLGAALVAGVTLSAHWVCRRCRPARSLNW